MIRSLLFAVCLALAFPIWGQRLSYLAAETGASRVTFSADHTAFGEVAGVLVRRHDLYFVYGYADRDTGYFLLDTGAPGLLLHTESLAHDRDVALAGTTGEVSARTATVAELAVANLRQRGVSALRLDLSALREAVGTDVVGVIGHAQLAEAATEINFRDRSIDFSASESGAAATTGTEYDFVLDGHLPTLPVSMGDAELRLAFDTGSEVNVLDHHILPQLREDLRGRPAEKHVSGVDARVARVPYALVRLTLLGDDQYRDRAFAFLPWGGFRQNLPQLDGLLGADFWGAERVTLDYPNRVIRTHSAE